MHTSAWPRRGLLTGALAVSLVGILAAPSMAASVPGSSSASGSASQAAEAAVTTAVSGAKAGSSRTVTFTRTPTAGRATPNLPPSITCTITTSGLLIFGLGDTWGPYTVDSALGAVGTSAAVTCTAPVPAITVEALVIWDDIDSFGPPVSTSGSRGGPAFALDACSEGTWQSGGVATVTAPAGYTPPTLNLAIDGAPITLQPTDCP